MININTVTLEGPDLSGKTTLYNRIHKKTEYQWDIRDRGFLSRVCFARQYGRNVQHERSRLEKSLCNLNNRLIILIPDFETLEKRYHKRGDEIQDIDSLFTLHKIYCEESKIIENLPSVLIIRDENPDLELIVSFLNMSENKSFKKLGEDIHIHVKNFHNDEYTLDLDMSGKIAKPTNKKILTDPHEGEYYREILWDFKNIIEKEKRGINPYKKPQCNLSRRFYYSSNSCISSIHMMPRGETLKCFVVFRSTNVVKNAKIDLEFLHFLVQEAGIKYFSTCKHYEIRVRMNSAHIVTI